jgi:nucleotide-binding universal stress UspA family protein/nitrite reductase/ring-hydroxylating ferredoxin subunit
VPYRKIFLGTDGSTQAGHALAVATAMARATNGSLTVLHASEDHPDPELVGRAVEAVKAGGVHARGKVLEGPPAKAVIAHADEKGAEVLVLGVWGTGGAQKHLIGSVPHRAAHHAPCDVLVVAEHESGRTPAPPVWERMVVATDGSPTADRAARRALELAGVLGSQVTLVFVGHPRTGELVLADTVESLQPQIEVRLRIEGGKPAEKILEVAAEERARLVVVGNKGMSGAARFLLGSVPQKVLEDAACDVLVIRTVTQGLAEIKRGEGGIVVQSGERIAVYRDPSGVVHGMSAKCTHMGCTVGWNPAEETFDCPCHGSRYSCTGEVVNGPAAKPLATIALDE